MAQTIEGFVGNALDEAKISPLHRRVVALIAAGYFFDVIDFTVFGSLVPYIIQSKFATGAEVAADRQRHRFSACSLAPPARANSATGSAADSSISSTCSVRHLHDSRRVCPERHVAGRLPLYRRHRARRRTAAVPSPMRANIRPSASAAASWRSCISSAAPACGRSERRSCLSSAACCGTPEQVWRGVWLIIGIGALIVWVFRFALPESPRYLATHGRGEEALDVLARLGIAGPKEQLTTDAASNTKSDPFGVVFTHVPDARHRRHDLLHGVLRRRHRPWRLAAEHHERQGLHHHQVAAIYPRHELRGAVREPVHDVCARQIRPQDHVGLRVHLRGHHGDGVRQCRHRRRSLWSPVSS